MTLQERVKSHLEQLSPHIKTRESATLLALCLGEIKRLEAQLEQASSLNRILALQIEGNRE